ncbi:uncharacterized protein MYCFIDRAFT_207763 [Pseudocercospora fijiensis CIRAD86]|uniref:Uncharacterized protein n=1 Tax=Pseudocercospora fijiensis (strain CIRAD86) TaxID=383855 RepID=M3AFE8_PSEFD|nr:uncharacterized protein MYCFIDRAFT_207763 [Pseudocercospora fijiensis CIRAD86]EME83306.1 hypothetical protein MYCFIDRAFT_207763 [Pseudocercospora fijiensis CIRAD86]
MVLSGGLALFTGLCNNCGSRRVNSRSSEKSGMGTNKRFTERLVQASGPDTGKERYLGTLYRIALPLTIEYACCSW